MSVASYQPGEQITVTAAAGVHIRGQIHASGHKYLRLGVKESGCNGYMYTLDYIDQPTPEDKAFEIDDDLCVYVSGQDLPLVAGTEVDFVTEGLNSALKFKNPNAESHCGCGESFSIDPAA
ncbi:MAG: iron-sulfur cluster assembly accessory protein [Gammaproteobacteria bacterium]|nr:iron-sulfur cluster assembly accessory protein [Gammaproteobacteria bacterium]